MGIRTKLIILLTAIVLIPLGISLAVIAEGGARLQERGAAEKYLALAVDRAHLLRSAILDDANESRLLASMPPIVQFVEDANRRRAGIPAEEVRRIGLEIQQGWGKTPAAERRLAGILENEASTVLRMFQITHPEFAELSVLNVHGETIAASARPELYFHEKGESILELARQRPAVDEFRGSDQIVIWAPVRELGRLEAVGLLRAAVKSPWWANVGNAAGEGRRPAVAVSDAGGKVVRATEEFPQAGADVPQVAEGANQGSLRGAGPDGEFIWGYAAVELPELVRLGVAAGPYARVWVGEPTTVSLAPVYENRQVILLTGGAAVVVIFIIGVLVTERGIVNRIQLLRQSAAKVGAGDFTDFPVEPNRQSDSEGLVNRVGYDPLGADEITELVNDFDKMARSLRTGYEEMEARVHNRTAALEQANAQLATSEARFRAITETAHDAIISLDEAGNIIAFNSAAERIFGYTRQEVLASPAGVLMPERYRARHIAGMARYLGTGKTRIIGDTVELYGLTKDGREIPIELSVSTYLLGTAHEFTAVIRDITDRRKAEQSLRDSDALYQSLVDHVPFNIFRKDLQGRTTFMNKRYCRSLKVRPEDILGKTDFDFFPKELAEKYVADDRRVIESGEVFETVEEHQTLDRRILVQVLKTPVKNAAGDTIGLQGIFWDVTEKHRLQDELRRSAGELAAANRSLRETQSQLVQQEKLASLGQLTAGVAHEVNNPLAYVDNNLSVLERDITALTAILTLYRSCLDVLEAARPEISATIARREKDIDIGYTLENLGRLMSATRGGVDRIRRIVGDLRDFSRLDRAEQEDADLDGCLDTTLEMLRHELKKNAITPVKNYGGLTGIRCHPRKMNQVFMNIIMNAIQASEPGKRLWLETRRAGDDAVVEIRDEGSGMSPEVLRKVFDPFFTTKPPGQGTGLGLSICYGIVREHGGRIEVDSTPGQGSTFRVIIPAAGPPPASPVTHTPST
jgi:PAS domain S-box-containing protein